MPATPPAQSPANASAKSGEDVLRKIAGTKGKSGTEKAKSQQRQTNIAIGTVVVITILAVVLSFVGTPASDATANRPAAATQTNVDPAKQAQIDALIETTREAARRSDYSAAINSLEELRVLNPDNLDVVWNLGNMYVQGDRRSDAIRTYQELLEKAPAFAEGYFHLAISQSMAENRKERLESLLNFKKAIALGQLPQDRVPDAYFMYARTLSELGRWQEAQPIIDSVMEQKPDYQDIYFLAGLNYEAQDMWEKALQAYARQCEVENSPRCKESTAKALNNLNRHTEAAEFLNELVRAEKRPFQKGAIQLSENARKNGSTVDLGGRSSVVQLLGTGSNYGEYAVVIDDFVTAKEAAELAQLWTKSKEQQATDPLLCVHQSSRLMVALEKEGFNQETIPVGDRYSARHECFTASAAQLKNATGPSLTTINKNEDTLSDQIDARLESVLGLRSDHTSTTQVVHYGKVGDAKLHADCHFGLTSNDRATLVLIFLSDKLQGGELNIPGISLSIAPKLGRLVVVPMVDADGFCDPKWRVQHQPVTSGDKFIVQKWYHSNELGIYAKGTPDSIYTKQAKTDQSVVKCDLAGCREFVRFIHHVDPPAPGAEGSEMPADLLEKVQEQQEKQGLSGDEDVVDGQEDELAPERK